MSLSDYATRQYDYLALQNTKPKGEAQLSLALFSPTTSGKITAGVQKLAQRWLLEFFTETGSMPGLPERGNTFIQTARVGGFRTELNVRTAFAAAGMTIGQNLRAEEDDTMPPDERYGSATLQSVAAIPGAAVNAKSGTTIVYLNMVVQLASLAGDVYDLIVPVETLP
jgi:hypothetical protein